MSIFYINVGIEHFTDPGWFIQIVPPYLSYKLELVYISGFFEVLFGFLLFFTKTRYFASWGIIILLAEVILFSFFHLLKPPSKTCTFFLSWPK